MRAQWMIGGLWMFVGAAFAGLFFAALGPVALVRLLGALALLGAICGVLLHVWMLRDAFPARWAALRRSLDNTFASGIARLRGGAQAGTSPA